MQFAHLGLTAALAWSFCSLAHAEVAVFNATARAQPAAVERPEEVRTAAAGEFVHRQFFSHDRLARVDAPITVVDVSKTYSVTPSNLLFGADVRGSDATAFCTFEITYTGRNGLGIEGRFPTCLVDRDSNGALDTIFARIGRGSYGVLVGDFRQDIPSPTSYVMVAEPDPERVEIGVKFERLSARRHELQVVHVGAIEGAEALRGGRIRIPDALPATINILGAQIEIVSLAEGVLSYRVKSEFDPSVSHRTNLLAELP